MNSQITDFAFGTKSETGAAKQVPECEGAEAEPRAAQEVTAGHGEGAGVIAKHGGVSRCR